MSTATTDNNTVRKELFVDGYEVVIGIEIHCQLNTESKIFQARPQILGMSQTAKPALLIWVCLVYCLF